MKAKRCKIATKSKFDTKKIEKSSPKKKRAVTAIGVAAGEDIDITKRKQAEEMLRESEEKWRSLVSTMPDYISLLDTEGRFLFLNHYADGFTEKDVIGSSVYEYLTKESQELFQKKIDEVLNTRKTQKFEHTALGDKSIWRDYEDYFIPIIGKNRVINILVISRDITERKRVEKDLCVKEERYRELFDNISSGVAVYEVKNNGEDFIFVDFNKAGERLDGDRRENLIGKSVFQMRPGIKEFGLTDVFKRVWKTGTAEYYPATLYQEGCLSKWYDNFVYRLPTGEIVAIYNDITERKRSEEDLKQMIERFDLSTRAGRMGVWDWDVQKNQLIWDDRMYELYGIEKQNFTGAYEAWLNGIHTDDAARSDEESKRALSGEKEYDTEFRVVWPDKTVRHLKAYAQVVRDSDGKPLRMTGINYDITEQKQAEEKLKSLLKEKELLIREVHHRVKNNFAVVSSLLNLQSRDMLDKEVQEMFMKSRDRIKSMSMIHERLYQSQDLTHINFAEYIRTLAADLYHTYGTDSLKVFLSVEADDISLNVDQAIPCGLIVNELISNSLKYGFPHDWNAKGQIKVTLRRIDENEIKLGVIDNGVGLPDDFDIRKTKSLGLKIITMLSEEQLGGKLMMDKKEGTGFFLQFKISY